MRFQVIFTYDPEYKSNVTDISWFPGCINKGKTIISHLSKEKTRGIKI